MGESVIKSSIALLCRYQTVDDQFSNARPICLRPVGSDLFGMRLVSRLFSWIGGRSSDQALSSPTRGPDAPPPVTWAFRDYSVALSKLERAQGMIRRRLYADAEKLLLEVQNELSGDRRVALALATVSHELARWPESQMRWEEFIKLDPTVGFAHSNRAVAIQMQGNVHAAIDLYRDMMFHFPDDLGPPIALAYLLPQIGAHNRGAYAEIAEAGLKDRLSRNPEHVGLIKAYAYMARTQGDLGEARAKLTLAHKLAINDEQIKSDLDEVVALLRTET